MILITSATQNQKGSVIFEDTQYKSTKKFELKIYRSNDGVFHISQTAYRIYPGGREVLKSEKLSQAKNIRELCEGSMSQTRQGKAFLNSLTVH